MKARVPYLDSKGEKQARKDIETWARSQVKELCIAEQGKLSRDLSILIMYALHRVTGFGKVRMERFLKDFSELYKGYAETYQVGESEVVRIAELKLKDKGIDVEMEI